MGRRLVVTLALLVASASAVAAYELRPGLRQQVEQLMRDSVATPTSEANAAARAAVLWEWANEVSLQGGFVPKNLPLVVSYLLNPTPGGGANAAYVSAVDVYVRQLAMLDRDPGAAGEVEVSPREPVVAASWQTIRVTWHVGSRGVDDGGGILASAHMMGGYGTPQATDPAGDDYVSITSSNPAVRFELDQAPVWGPYGGFRAARQFPVFRVRGGSLRKGDTVTLLYGDTTKGGRGLEIGTFSNDAIALPLAFDPGDGSFYELPLATFKVIGGEARAVHGFAPSIVGAGEPVTISVRTEDRFANRASSGLPGYEVRLDGKTVQHLAPGRALQTVSIRLDDEGVRRVGFVADDGSFEGVANPILVERDPATRIYWGETHGHCGFAEGQGTPEGFFRFARDDARLDFVTLTEHDVWLTDGNWRILNEVAGRFHDPRQMVVYPGYEWSSPRQRGGHHNVFFRRPGFERVPIQAAPNLTELYRQLRQRYDVEDVLIIPHAHQAADWRLSDLDMETLVEIMSSHGTFEWFGQRYLEHGYRVGFVGASDDHIGHPGYAVGMASVPGSPRPNIFQYGGLAGVWSAEKSTDAIFDALHAKSAYAVSGSQRIVLAAHLNGAGMGQAVPDAEKRRVEGRAVGTAPIRRIDLVRNGEVVGSLEPNQGGALSEGRGEVVVGFYSDSSVSIRDNPRGHRTWRGKLQVTGAEVVSARLLGTPSPTADELVADAGKWRFDVATRGSRRALALMLDGASAATKIGFEIEAGRERGTAPVQVRRPQQFPAASFELGLPKTGEVARKVLPVDEYQDAVTVEIGGGGRDEVEFSFDDTGSPGDWYYVRVEQVDGNLAWSSPWWVGGEPPR